MSAATEDPESIDYDEFGLLHENIAEFDLDVAQLPEVERIEVELPHDPGRRVSAIRWGTEPPEVVFVHGGAQNAHTWDTVVLALGRPAIAIDLPGHGHSDWREDGAYSPQHLAADIAPVIAHLAPDAPLLVGMSLGGLTSLEVAARHGGHTVSAAGDGTVSIRHLVLVDITPGVNAQKAKAVIDFVDGPQRFDRFDDLLARTMEHNPTRSESSLRRGILHNATQNADGSWQWRYDRSGHSRTRSDATEGRPDAAHGATPVSGDTSETAMSPLWDDLGSITCAVTLVRGSLSPVVDDDDVAEARRRQPDLAVHLVEGAGHSVQGDRPIELAALVADLL